MAENKSTIENGEFLETIHVMPDEYYGVNPQVARVVAPPVAPNVVPMRKATPPPVAAKPVVKKAPVNRLTMMLIIGGLVFITLLLGYLVYLSYFSGKQPVVNNEPVVVVVTNEPVIEPINTPVIPTPEPEPTPLVPLTDEQRAQNLSSRHETDTDGDGLTDMEELLLGTKVDNKDTDGDGFLDGTEVLNLYNPIGTDPAKIEFSGLVTTYVNPIYQYNLFYPNKWFARTTDAVNNEVVFTSPLDESVILTVEEKPGDQTLKDWYLSKNPTVLPETVTEIATNSQQVTLMSADGFAFYLAKGTFVYILKYDIGTKQLAAYPSIFRMMVESFVFTEKK